MEIEMKPDNAVGSNRTEQHMIEQPIDQISIIKYNTSE